MIFLAVQPPGKLSGAHEIAAAQRLPKPFLWKVLHKLRRKKLVRSFKGVGGGYELARPARRIRLHEVLSATGATPVFPSCIFGFSDCPKPNLCPLQPACAKIRNDLQLMKQRTIADLARMPGKPGR